jgi:hypothetical protein
MNTIQLFVALNLVFAILALAEMPRRPRKPVRKSRLRHAPEARLDAYVRVAQLNGRTLPAQTRLSLCVAPLDAPGTALDISTSGSTTRIAAADLRDVRLWLRGREVAAAGSPSHEEVRPLAAELAAWEVEVSTRGGEMLRCYGDTLPLAAEHGLVQLRRWALLGTGGRVAREPVLRRSAPSIGYGEAYPQTAVAPGL